VTVAGTVALWLLLESETTVPDAPAGPENVTVPIDGLPPTRDVGVSVNDTNTAGVIVNVAVFDWLARLAVMLVTT
jgi:hypothetical protein